MAFLSLFALGFAILATAFWALSRWSDERSRAAFAKRNVKYVPQPNAFVQVLTKQRLEEPKHKIIQTEGKVWGFNFLNAYTICVAEPEIAQLVMSKEFTNFTNRRAFELSDPFFANALSVVQDEQWKRLRAVVTPTFAAGKLRRMKPLIDDIVRTLQNNFDNFLKKSDRVNVKEVYGAFTMDTVIQVAFGTKVDSLVDQENPIIKNAKKLFSVDMSLKNILIFTIVLMTPRLANMLKLRLNGDVVDYFNEFGNSIIKRKRAEMEAGQIGKANSFIELLLEAKFEEEQLEGKQNGKANGHVHKELDENGNVANGSIGENGAAYKKTKFITNEELLAQCSLFFLAGYDTTATTITMASYLLSINPDEQEKLHREIVSLIEKLSTEAGPDGPKDPVELVTIESLPRFEYLNAVINETLRIYSPATFTERLASKDMVLATEDGRVKIDLKKGDIVHFPLYSMHRDPEQFPEPEVFRPERFLGQPSHHKYSYMPFGSGPRNCVAKSLALLEAKLALLHTIRQYKLSVCPETKNPPEFYYQSQLIVPKDIVLKVEKR